MIENNNNDNLVKEIQQISYIRSLIFQNKEDLNQLKLFINKIAKKNNLELIPNILERINICHETEYFVLYESLCESEDLNASK